MAGPEKLLESFAVAADEARIATIFAEKVCHDAGRGLDLLGSGTHFSAYRVRGEGGMDLVLKRAHRHFAGGPSTPGREAWLRALKLADGARGCPLLPPWLVLKNGDDVGLAMPFGPEAADRTSLGAEIAILTGRLAKLGLEIADHLQIRGWRGVPFVIDLSDLRRKAPGSP